MQTRSFLSMFQCVFSGLVVVTLALFGAGCAENVKDIRTDGVQQFREGQYVDSLATMRYALRKNPNDAESNYYMGLNYRAIAERHFRSGDIPAARRNLDNAIYYFTQAIKTQPNYMAAVQAKAEALESGGKYDAAVDLAAHVATNNRGVAEHFVFLGDEYRQRADYDNALRAYKTALATDANNARAYAGLGKLYAQTGNQQLATEALAKAHELNPSEPEPEDAVAGTQAPSEAKESGPSPTSPPPAEPTPSKPPRIYSGR